MLAVLQIDAVSVPRVEELIADGRLPNLAELRSRGKWLDLDTPATHFPAGSYATLYSGLDVPDHGMYYAFQWSPSHQRVRWRGEFAQPLMVWERLARAGKRTLVVDPYECLPPAVSDGVVLAGYQLVNMMSLPRWSSPPLVERELDRLFGPPRDVNEVFGQPTPRGLLDLRRRLLAATDRAAEVAVHFLRRDRFDLVWVNLLAGHLGGHMFWNLSQLEEQELDDAARTLLAVALDDIYVQMDQAVGRIVAEIPDADLVLCSPMGMGVNMSRVDLLPSMLEAVLSSNGQARTESRAERFLWRLRGAVPIGVRAKAAAALHGPLTREVTMRLSSLGVDWSKTPVFMLPSDHFAQLRLNLRGREREGIVEPREADELVEGVREGLMSFREPSGAQSVVAVERTRDVLGEGTYLEMLPDLIVRWDESPSNGVDHVSSPEHGDVRRPGSGSGRSGAHTPHAWALVVAQSLSHTDAAEPHLRDIAATVCEALGVETSGLRGRPLLAV